MNTNAAETVLYSEIDFKIEFDSNTREHCYESDSLNACWNEYTEEGSFHFGGWYTRGYQISYDLWKGILEDMVKNLDDYSLTKSVEPYHTEGEFLRHRLNHMPFDKYEDGKGFIHATGWEYLEVNGDWVTEYEDDLELEE